MKQEKHVPERRFREFAETWNEQPFDEVFDTSVPTNTFARDDLNDVAGTVRNIHYGDVLIKYPAIVDAQKEKIPYLNEGISTITDERQYLQNGDIVMADTAEDETAGKVVELENAEEHSVIAGLHTMVLRPSFPFGTKFLGYKLNAPSYHDQLIPLMQGTKVTSVNKQALSETNIVYPSNLAEQGHIGEFLYRLDALIALHESKLQKLEHLKQAYLTEMFPAKDERQPRRRFKGFSGDWDCLTFGDIIEQFDETVDLDKDDIPLYSVTIENGLTEKTERYNRESLVKKRDIFKAIYPSQIVFNPMNMTIGSVGVNDTTFKVAVSGYYIVVQPNDGIDSYFLYTYMKSPLMLNIYSQYATGSLREKQRVQFPTLASIPCQIPCYGEQQKIGTFMRTIDQKISLEQECLGKLRALKQAYLSELFV